ncbi:MAG TPA: DUF6476 family protein [Stellaceae bacterium]
MAALKALVVVMGIMLVVGFVALIVVIAGRVSQKTAGLAAAQPYSAAPVEIPAGARVEAMSAGPDRLILDLLLPDGNRELAVIDLGTGRRLGTIPLRTAR